MRAIYFLFIILDLIFISAKWYSKCNNIGICSLSNDKNNWIEIEPGNTPILEGEILEPFFEEFKNDSLINFGLSSGVSKFGILKGLHQYECAGGLEECINGCCKNGYCYTAIFLCKPDKEFIKQIYIMLGTSFGGLIILYWFVFYLVGTDFNAKKEKNYEIKNNQDYIEDSGKNIYSQNKRIVNVKKRDNDENEEGVETKKKARIYYDDNIENESNAKSSNDNSFNSNKYQASNHEEIPPNKLNNIENFLNEKNSNLFEAINNCHSGGLIESQKEIKKSVIKNEEKSSERKELKSIIDKDNIIKKNVEKEEQVEIINDGFMEEELH